MAARLLDTSPSGPLPTDKIIGQYYVSYGESGMDDLVNEIQDQIAQYLQHDPVLGIHQNEEGAIELVVSGEYAGRYALEMRHYPLVPGLGPDIFQQMTFVYAASFIGPTQVSLPFVTAQHETGEVWALAPGVPEGLAGISFGAGNTVPNVLAVGHVSTYAAGYSTGLNDPVPSGGGTGATFSCTVAGGTITSVTVLTAGTGYVTQPFLVVTGDNARLANLVAQLDGSGGIASVLVVSGGEGYSAPPTVSVTTRPSFYAPPIPPTIQRAALFLLREAVLMEENFDATLFNMAASGTVTGIVDGSQKVTWGKVVGKEGPDAFCLGYQTPLATAAERKLNPYKRKRIITLI